MVAAGRLDLRGCPPPRGTPSRDRHSNSASPGLTPALSRQLAWWVRPRSYSDDEFFLADGADERAVARRRAGINRLAHLFETQHPRSAAWGDAIRSSLSDLRFTDANRVPFPFARFMRERFSLCSVVTASRGPWLRDLDGHWALDLSGSYGLNVAGFDRYKEWMTKGLERVRDLGPVLGPLHPVVAENIELLRSVSTLDEVSFHMSGTEAVMAAVRLARFNTRRRLIVCFAGAYHGWWDGVQPGLGSERSISTFSATTGCRGPSTGPRSRTFSRPFAIHSL